MSRRPRISYRDLARQAPAGNEGASSAAAPAEEPAMSLPPDIAASAAPTAPSTAGGPPQQHDADGAAPRRDRSDAPGTEPSPADAVAASDTFATPSFLAARENAPRVQRGAPSALRFRDRVRAREGVEELLVFRVAGELFAVELSAVEEAMDCPPAHALPEMPASMRGVFMLRSAPVALYAPNALLGLEPHAADTVLVFRPNAGGRRAALAIDDVDDVLVLDLATLRDAPGTEAADGILTGVARRGRDLIGVLDAEALLAACRSDTALETV